MALFKSKKQSDDRPEREEFIIDGEHKIIFNSSGLVPVVIQDDRTSEVLKLGYLNRWALEMSLNDKKVYLFRRSLQRLEAFGENKGIEYEISTIQLDRNRRSILFKVIPLRNRRTDHEPESIQERGGMESGGADTDPQAQTNQVQTDFLHLIYSNKKRA